VEYGPFDDRDVYVVKMVDEPTDPDAAQTFTALASVMKPAPKFAVEDKVTSHAFQGQESVIVAGPFMNRFRASTFWVVEREGKHASLPEYTLTKVTVPEPTKIGDRVRVVYDSDGYRSGQYVGLVGVLERVIENDELRYLVRFGDGSATHGDKLNGRWYCKEVERDEGDANTHEYNGVTYDLSAKYEDVEGDVWRLKRVGDVVRARLNDDGEAPTAESFSLEYVANRWAPLTRVEDSNIYVHGGVTYDLSATYRDKDGDRWNLRRNPESTDEVQAQMRPLDEDEWGHYTLRTLVTMYGPLTRV
jgi:hypothetical protein